MFIHTFGVQRWLLGWSRWWGWKVSEPLIERTPGDTHGCLKCLEPPTEWDTQLCNRLTLPSQVSLRFDKETAAGWTQSLLAGSQSDALPGCDRDQLQHNIFTTQHFTVTFSNIWKYFMQSVFQTVFQFMSFIHCLQPLDWIWDTYPLFCIPPGILWNTLVSVSPVVML